MKNKVVVIGIIKNGDSILMRKKPDGSEPYKETWYSLGVNVEEGNPIDNYINWIRKNIGINIFFTKKLSWDVEIKNDHRGDNSLIQFIYLDAEFNYQDGDIIIPEEYEKIEWVNINDLKNLDIVPPSVEMLKKLGYL